MVMKIISWLYELIRDTALLIIAGSIVTFVGITPILQITILGIIEHSPWEAALILGAWYIVTTIFGRIFSAIRNSFKDKNIGHRLKISPKILYLRSFKNDTQEISEGLPAVVSGIFSIWQTFDPLKTLNSAFSSRFETKLAEQCDPYGCLVCLSSNPGKFSTPPEGSVRIITEDTNWKSTFQRLFNESIYTIVLVDKSPALEWELEQISSSNAEDRILYLLPSKKDAAWKKGWDELAAKGLVPDNSSDDIISARVIGYKYLSHQTNEVEFICKNNFLRSTLDCIGDAINDSNLKKDPYHEAKKIAINSWRLSFIFINVFLLNQLIQKSINIQILGVPLGLLGLFLVARSITSLYKALRSPYKYRVAYGYHLMAGSLFWIFVIIMPIVFIFAAN